MTSGSAIPSSAINIKASSTLNSAHRNQPVRSPSDRHSSLSKSKSPTPETVTTSPPSLRGLNGGSNSRHSHGQDESEAETEILSDEPGKSKAQPKQRVVNHEHKNDDHRSSPALSSRTDPRRKHAASTGSSVNGDAPDKGERKSSGPDKRENGHAKAAVKERLRLPLDNGSAASRAQSADASTSPQSQLDRERQARSAEPRKRKFSDSQRPTKLEPPRQKLRLDGAGKPTPTKAHHKIRRPSSPPQPPTPGTRTTHKRSASNQTAFQVVVPAVQSRKKRESSISTKSSDRQEWNSGSSSEDESRLGPPIPLLAPLPRSSRSTQRALASPARTMPLGSKRADRYGLTPLLKACERGSFEGVKQAYEEAPAELDQPDNGGFAPLQKAALGGHADIVQFLLDKGCRRDCHSTADQDSPLIDAVDNGHVEVVKILLAGGVNPHHQNNQGKRAIDAVDDADAEEDEKVEMKELIDQAMRDFEGSDGDDDDDDDEADHTVPRKEGSREDLLYIEPNRKNLIEYSRKGDVVAVGHFIESVEPTVACAVVAARGGHHLVLNLLLAAGDSLADPDPLRHDETPMLAAIGRGHLRVIKLLLETENFNPTRTTRDGKRYFEVAEQMHGPKWQKEVKLLKDHYDAYVSKRKLTPGGKKRKQGESSKSTEHSSRMPKSSESPKALKHKRLMTRKEMPGKDSKRRSRPVLDSSQSEGSDSEVRITKKPMRIRKGSIVGKTTRSGPPSPVTNRQPSASKSKTTSTPIPELKPPSKETRKAPGPRKSSSQSIENHPPSDQETTKDVKPIKQSTPEEEREARLVAEKERAAELERQEEAIRLQKEAEQRKRDEEAAAKEAERKAAEAAAQEAERKAEEERIRLEKEKREREERLNALPTALRIAVEKGPKRPLRFGPPSKDHGEELGISMQFLPIHLFTLGDVEPKCEEAEKDEQLMMSFQVVGILGLPSELRMTEFPDWKRQDVTPQHRKMFLRSYDLSQLAQEYRWLQAGENGYNARLIREGLAEAKQKFLAMQPLSFVRYADFLEALKKPEYDHLAGLEMRTSTRCCVTEKTDCRGFDLFGGVKDEKPVSNDAKVNADFDVTVNVNVNVNEMEENATAGAVAAG
ncbi:Protein HOS4 [Venturia nashicola]|nr:Protein HOS4 [Venturia nashicola]